MSTVTPDAVIAVFELRPYWGPELQRQFGQSNVSIRECRSVDDLLPSISDFRKALVILDLDADLARCVTWLGCLKRNIPNHFSMIACGSQATRELEWVLREAGVTAFLPNVIPGDEFARLCRRQLGQSKRLFQRHTGVST